MRILFMHHFPLRRSEAGLWVARWNSALAAAGHECRCLIVDDDADRAGETSNRETAGIVRVTCRPNDPTADLPFEIPHFSTERPATAGLTFAALSDQQLADYRDRIRRRLDVLIDSFNPHIIHAQHVWVQGQLALETGVPYLLNAWGPEFIDYSSDERYRRLADQAAENAGRILVPHVTLFEQVAALFETAAERTQIMPPELALADATAGQAEGLLALYQAILAERFGDRHREE